jgi:tetratricopeptide (TPR) repeat protein
MNLFLCFLVIAFTLCAYSASAQTQLRCLEQLEERTAAMTARDWLSLERLAKRYLQSCHGVTGNDAHEMSLAYEQIAIANSAMHRAQDALKAADSCVIMYYANPGCHLEKALALLALNRLLEARDVLDVTERLLHSALRQNDLALRTTYTSVNHELHLALKHKYVTKLQLVEALRARFFGH